jgi:hypothetical protein
MSFDPTMQAIMDAIADHTSAPADRRARFTAIWRDLGDAAEPLHRCILAHYMADVQDDPESALRWDLRALAAVRDVDGDAFAVLLPGLALESFLPSLHLNLAEDYDRLARPDEARRHLVLARESLAGLAEDGYGQMIRNGVERLAAKLGGG